MDTTLNNDMNALFDEASSQLPPEVIETIGNSIVQASQGAVQGLKLGDKAPDFTLENHDGTPVNLYQELKQGPVVLSFFRGEWCPFCNVEHQALQKELKTIEDKNATLLAIHPQPHQYAQQLQEKLNLSYRLLSDPGQDVMTSYDVRFEIAPEVIDIYQTAFGLDLTQLNANGEWNLPVPATFVVDTDHVIKGRFFSHNYAQRMEPKDIVRVLENLPEQTPEPVYDAN